MVLLRVIMLRAVLLLSATALAACDVGEVKINGGVTPDGPGGASAAKIEMFDSVIKPMATAASCLDAGCHSGIQVPVLNTWDSLGAKYKTGPGGATNILVTKGGTPAPGTHSAKPYFTDVQRATIAAWIDMP